MCDHGQRGFLGELSFCPNAQLYFVAKLGCSCILNYDFFPNGHGFCLFVPKAELDLSSFITYQRFNQSSDGTISSVYDFGRCNFQDFRLQIYMVHPSTQISNAIRLSRFSLLDLWPTSLLKVGYESHRRNVSFQKKICGNLKLRNNIRPMLD